MRTNRDFLRRPYGTGKVCDRQIRFVRETGETGVALAGFSVARPWNRAPAKPVRSPGALSVPHRYRSVRSELDLVSRREALFSRSGALDPVNATVRISIYIPSMQHKVVFSCASQRIGLNPPRLVGIVQIDTEPVCGRKANDFEIRSRAIAQRQMQRSLPNDPVAAHKCIRGRRLGNLLTTKPSEEFGQSAPEGVQRRQGRKLTRQHRVPCSFEIVPMFIEVAVTRYGDTLELAFPAENVEQYRWGLASVFLNKFTTS